MSSFEDAQTFLNFIIATRLSKLDAGTPFQSVTKPTTESVPDDNVSFNNADNVSQILQISDGELRNIPSEPDTTGRWQPLELEAESIRAAVSETAVPTCRKGGKPITVAKIYLYPIKSCSAFEVCALNYSEAFVQLSLVFVIRRVYEILGSKLWVPMFPFFQFLGSSPRLQGYLEGFWIRLNLQGKGKCVFCSSLPHNRKICM